VSNIEYGRSVLEEVNVIETLHRPRQFVASVVLAREGTTLRWSKEQGYHFLETIEDDCCLLLRFPDLRGNAPTRIP
jgi:hypothetical protein